MRKLLLLLLLLPMSAVGVQNSATPSRVVLANTNLASTWIVMVGTTAKAVKGLYVSSSAADSLGAFHDILIGIASSTAPYQSEVPQMLVPSAQASLGVFIPFVTQAQVRISVEGADTATLSQGEIILNPVFY